MGPSSKVLAILAVATVVGGVPVEEIPGLEAWYKIGSQSGRAVADGETVQVWADSSGSGHDLVLDEGAAPAVYRTRRLNERTVVEIAKGSAYSPRSSIELADHTLFLVYASTKEERALFRSAEEGEDFLGIVLRGEANRDQYRKGAKGFAYNAAVPLGEEFSITVLGRQAGRLRSFVNGVDLSSKAELPDPIRVGRFFQISKTRFVRLDGAGLAIAEMILFDRYLTGSERRDVTEYLSEKYGIGPWNTAEALRRVGPDVALASWHGLLKSNSEQDFNVPEATRIAWNVQERLGSGLAHDPAEDPTRIHCTEDNTKVSLFVSLSVTSSAPGADVRVLVLKNDGDYLTEEANTGPMAGDGGTIPLQIETEAVLNKGDYLSIVTIGEGEPGRVSLDAGQALLALR